MPILNHRLTANAIIIAFLACGQAAFAVDQADSLEGPEAAIRYIDEGDKYLGADDLVKATAAYKRAAQVAPLNSSAHQRLGYAYSLQNILDDAEKEGRKAIELDKGNALAHANLGWVYGRQGKYRAAVAEERLAIALDPDLAIAHQTLGLALTSLGDYPSAVKEFERSIILDPDDLPSYLNLAAALGRKGDYAGSISVYRKAISLNRRSVVAHLGLGAALGKVGDKDGQLKEFQAAVALSPKSPITHGKLGWALSQKKDWRGALREGIITNILRLENSWSTFMKALITVWASVFLVSGAIFAFVFSGSRFKPQPGEQVLNSYFLVFYKDKPGRFVITTRRLVYVPESVSQWFGATRVSIEQEQVEKVESQSTLSGGTLTIITKDQLPHRFKMPNLVLEPLQRKLSSLTEKRVPGLAFASFDGEAPL